MVEVGVVTMAAAAAATACACLASSAIIGQLHTSFDLPGALLAPLLTGGLSARLSCSRCSSVWWRSFSPRSP